MILCEFESLLDQYDVFFFDSYGVIKNFYGKIEGIVETLDYLEKKNKVVRIITNDASRDSKALVASFQKIGIDNITEEMVISSGMMAKNYLINKVKTGKVAYLGTEKSSKHIIQAGREAIHISKLRFEDYDDISAFVFLDDEGFDWNVDLNKTFNLLRYRNIPTIVANTDKVYPKTDKELALATGSVASLIENVSGRTFIKFGKPDTQVFLYATESIPNYTSLKKSQMVMVGDSLHTDILGGNKFGISTALVLSGNTSEKEADLMIRSTSIIPDYICKSAGTK
jgi:HAD superfamily hydrolase (TIGR01450 family)